MKTASQRFEGLYNVDEPGMGWQPVDDKDAKRAKKRLKHMSENPQIVAMVLDNYTENVPVPDSQEAVVIYDEITDQWDDWLIGSVYCSIDAASCIWDSSFEEVRYIK